MNFQHFLYALLNILNEMSPYILLGFLIAGALHVFIRPAAMSRHLAGKGWQPVMKAALFGIPLPLCSCGVLPTAVALRRQGASKGATTSFLIATPQTGVDSIAATYALLGLPFAILRPIAALTGALAGGMAVDRASGREQQYNQEEIAESATDATCAATSHQCAPSEQPPQQATIWQKAVESVRYGFVDMVASVGKWLVIGLVIAAIITVAVPDSLFLSLSEYPLPAMLVMVAVAVPMYICATGSIPIALSLMLKGLTPGVAFVLLMAGPAANFASVMVLRKSLGSRSTAIYVGSVVVTAIAFGLLIDYLLPHGWFIPPVGTVAHTSCHVQFNWFATSCTILLIALLINAFVRSRIASHRFHSMTSANHTEQNNNQPSNKNDNMQTIYLVKGMSCNHCKTSVEKAITALDGVESVVADLATGKVAVDGTVAPAAVEQAVVNAGFEFGGKA